MRFLANLFFILSVQFIFGQYFPSTNYTTAEGLPNNAVRALFLDKENVLWIGTENGVSRFVNGIFQNISEDDGLGHNSCWHISQDANGAMWFASYGGGISKFDGSKFTIFTTKQGLPSNKTRKVFPFKDKLYVGTELGISIIDINSNKVISPKAPKFQEDFICLDFFTYKDEVYFLSFSEGLFKIDESTAVPKVVSVFPHKNNYSVCLVDKTIYLSNEGFIQKMNIESILNKDFSTTKFGKSMVFQYATTKSGQLFCASDGSYNPDGGLYQIVADKMINVSKEFGIDSNILLNVVYDKSKDILYVGANDQGIYEVRLDKKIEYNPFDNLNIIDFEELFTTKFVLHTKGISLLDANQFVYRNLTLSDFKKFQQLSLQKNKSLINTDYSESRDFKLNFNIPAEGIVFYEMVKHNSSIWIASNLGIYELNEKGTIINYIPKHSLKIGFTADNKFIETITHAGVYLYDDVYNLKGKHYSKFDNQTPQFIVKILNNKGKTYLASVFNGLFVYQKGKFQSYLNDKIWTEAKFKHITKNDKGQLILAAEFGDVYVIDDTNKFQIITKIPKYRIIGNSINFLEAYQDYILIGTEKGVNVYQNGKIRLFDKEQGLKDSNFKTSQIFDGLLWLGTQKGFYTLDLKKVLKHEKEVTSVSIGSIMINNKPLPKSDYKWFQLNSKELVTDYQNNSFSIDFIPKGHLFPNKLKFRYRLNEDNNWSPYAERPNLFLSYLPNGNYNVEVEVLDISSGKSSVFNLLRIIVLPPFWLTWWFFILVVVIVFTTLYLLFVNYKKKIKEKAIIEKRIEEIKLDSLLSQMNPHFTFNAMNTIQDFIISNDVDNSLAFVSDLAKLMRLTLDNSSKKTISLAEEISYLQTYIRLENVRFGNRITVTFDVEANLDTHFIEVPTMLLQPFIENVFVHAFNDTSKNPSLFVSFRMKEKNLLECKVVDNGKGKASFDKVKLHDSKALKLASERLLLLQPEIKNPISTNFTESNGTEVIVLLKV